MAEANWAVDLPSEVWALVAAHRGVVGACQLMRVCKDAHAGGKEYLRTLPGLVVCGGRTYTSAEEEEEEEEMERVSGALRLDLATMRWVPMPALVTARTSPACCAVRGAPVVLGGRTAEGGLTSSECGDAFFFRGGGRDVCGAPAAVVRRDVGCSRDQGGRERQRRGASAPDRRRRCKLRSHDDGAAGRPGHWCICATTWPPPPALQSSGGGAAAGWAHRLRRGRRCCFVVGRGVGAAGAGGGGCSMELASSSRDEY
jgi:hypothetical protein